MNDAAKKAILAHYTSIWHSEPSSLIWRKGPMLEFLGEFRVLEFAPSDKRNRWTYATCGMSTFENTNHIELHLFSSVRDESIVELLTAVAYFHIKTKPLDLDHTVFFGRPWQNNSKCEYGLISLPYLDGPDLEKKTIEGKEISFYWLIPLTKAEVEYKKHNGIERLEEKLETAEFNYLDPKRNSVV